MSRKRDLFLIFAVVCLFVLGTSESALACPLIGGLIDFNCNRSHRVVVVGDSVVRGIGDARFKNNGGYVKRVGRRLTDSTVANLGFAGITSSQLLADLKQKLRKKKANVIKNALFDSDLVIIDVGRNDFFLDEPPGFTVRNIKRLVKFLRQDLGKGTHIAPLIAVAKLTPTTRGFQRNFIESVNEILTTLSSEDLPVRLNFDLLDPVFISNDGIHPTSDGYAALSADLLDYINGTAQDEALARRPDVDADGVFDLFENTTFLTDPALVDTDGDQLSDGLELFTYGTQALLPDTDGDGVTDGAEIAAGTDPLVANVPATSL